MLHECPREHCHGIGTLYQRSDAEISNRQGDIVGLQIRLYFRCDGCGQEWFEEDPPYHDLEQMGLKVTSEAWNDAH